MSGMSPTDKEFERALHEAGHFLAGLSLALGNPLWLTIKPYNRSGGQCVFKFEVDLSLVHDAHYSLGGLVAQLLFRYALQRPEDNEDVSESDAADVFGLVLDELGRDSHDDIMGLRARPDYDAEVAKLALFRCVRFMRMMQSELWDLAVELVTVETLHYDEGIIFLNNPLRFYRARRRAENRARARPDLQLMESYSSFIARDESLNREQWVRRIQDAFRLASDE